MIRILVIFAAMAAVMASATTHAQDDRAAEAEERMEQAKARLNLTDEQADQMAPVLESSIEARREILANYGVDLESGNGSASKLGFRKARAMKKELEVVRADTLDAVDDILTDEQLDEFRRIQEERQAEVRERFRGGG